MKMKELEVKAIRYFETRRGLGYECQTNIQGVEIWNDGMGGGTFIPPYYPHTKDYNEMTESQLERVIDKYESR